MTIDVHVNFEVAKATAWLTNLQKKQVPFATSVALNKVTEQARERTREEMQRVFVQPTQYFLNSLRVQYSTKRNLKSAVLFKDKTALLSAKSMVVPHIEGGARGFKQMEKRLYKIGVLPGGWFVMPGNAAPMDSAGNMQPGEISRILNVLAAYSESGYNKANQKTIDRLKKGNKKKNIYGFEYWVNPVGTGQRKHLMPGIYRRVETAFGTAIQPMMVFVQGAKYQRRLDFYGIGKRLAHERFGIEFEAAMRGALATAKTST